MNPIRSHMHSSFKIFEDIFKKSNLIVNYIYILVCIKLGLVANQGGGRRGLLIWDNVGG